MPGALFQEKHYVARIRLFLELTQLSLKNENCDRLVLGTAQLGFSYGIANQTGKPPMDEALGIIQKAWESGIHEFDTARGYGDSEKILGEIFTLLQIQNSVNVVTKLATDIDYNSRDEIKSSIERSLHNLQVPALNAVLLHDENLLDIWNDRFIDLVQFKQDGIIKNTGVSVYSVNRALQAIELPQLDIIQLPTNILDQRFVKASVFKYAKERNKKIYIRSIFLQGLLLMDDVLIPEKLNHVIPILKRIKTASKKYNLLLPEIALGYIKENFLTEKVIFGAETIAQVEDNVKFWNNHNSDKISNCLKEIPAIEDEQILNPSLWTQD